MEPKTRFDQCDTSGDLTSHTGSASRAARKSGSDDCRSEGTTTLVNTADRFSNLVTPLTYFDAGTRLLTRARL